MSEPPPRRPTSPAGATDPAPFHAAGVPPEAPADAPAAPLLPVNTPGDARRQLLAAYAAAAAKVVAWVIVAAVVYRELGMAGFALLVLARATLGVLNYTAFGLGPALVHFIARTERPVRAHAIGEEEMRHEAEAHLQYPARHAPAPLHGSTSAVLRHAALLLLPLGTLGAVLLVTFITYFDRLFEVPGLFRQDDIKPFLLLYGVGILSRLGGDVFGGATQGAGRVGVDQLLVAVTELLWATLIVLIGLPERQMMDGLQMVALLYAATGGLAFVLRSAAAITIAADQVAPSRSIDPRLLKSLLVYGGLVTLGSIADFLYAPIDYIILNRLVDPLAVAVYAPAVQVDAALILLVTAIATVMLPRTAILHARGDAVAVWREYVRASLAAAGITLLAALAAWAASPWLFNLWLGDDLPATRAILPLVLLHTVIGASAGVGRATLIAVGRAGAYAASVLVGGLLNVGLSLAFVYAGFGVWGVVMGTVISVSLRCLLWMPWFIRRSVRR